MLRFTKEGIEKLEDEIERNDNQILGKFFSFKDFIKCSDCQCLTCGGNTAFHYNLNHEFMDVKNGSGSSLHECSECGRRWLMKKHCK